MSIFYLNNANEWETSDNSTIMKLQEMLQRLQTFQGEKPFFTNDGIDYLGVFNGQVILELAIDEIVSEYLQFFENINYEIVEDKGTVSIKMMITFKEMDKGSLNFVLRIGG